VTGLENGSYLFVWTAENGSCPLVRDSMYVFLELVRFPTGFSPNGDQVNDNLVFSGLANVSGKRLQIFNRWGKLVFVSNDYQNDWNGNNSSGEALPDDTYFYILEWGENEVHSDYLLLKR
jgi:gliding motility-associated-like protein